MPPAVTPLAASLAPVNQDTTETVSPAQVCQLKHASMYTFDMIIGFVYLHGDGMAGIPQNQREIRDNCCGNTAGRN